jgi:transcription elongation factor Elf1
MPEYNDYPIEECAATAAPYVARGATFFQKFTCARCGSRQTCDEPNKFFKTAACEACGHVTDIARQGCNYMLAFDIGGG